MKEFVVHVHSGRAPLGMRLGNPPLPDDVSIIVLELGLWCDLRSSNRPFGRFVRVLPIFDVVSDRFLGRIPENCAPTLTRRGPLGLPL